MNSLTPTAHILVLGLASLWLVGAPASRAEPAKSGDETAPKTKTALKLAGLVTFVASSCPDLEPDYARFKRSIGALGMSYGDLDKESNKSAYLAYVLRYKEDTAKNCARALKDFGPGGTVIADLVKPKLKLK